MRNEIQTHSMPAGLYHCNFGDGGIILQWHPDDGVFLQPGVRPAPGMRPWGFLDADTYAAWDPIAGAYRVCTARRHWPHAGLQGSRRVRERDRAFSKAAELRAADRPIGFTLRPWAYDYRCRVPAKLRLVWGSGTFDVEIVGLTSDNPRGEAPAAREEG